MGEGQCLTAAGVVPPAGQGGTCFLANDCIPAEDLAAQLLLRFGVSGDTQVKHTVPGEAVGKVGAVRGGGDWDTRPCRRGPGSPSRKTSGSVCLGVCVLCIHTRMYWGRMSQGTEATEK